MTKKRNAKPPVPSKPDPNCLTVAAGPGDDSATAIARAITRPSVQAALTLQSYQAIPNDELSVNALVSELTEQCRKVSEGDLLRGEAMLTAQAHTLDAIFGTCARRAGANMGSYPKTAEMYLRLAFKAQTQCRSTWETLSQMKNPTPVAFVRQANIANGLQQVNNGTPVDFTRARAIENKPNELLEAEYGKRLDTAAPGAASGSDTALATLAAINGPEDGGR
jgi:hypothetical protein